MHVPSAAPLVLLAGGSAMHRFVPQALVSFLRSHPDVDVTVSECRTPETMRLLAAGEADLGIVQSHEAIGDELPIEALGDDSLVAIGQAGGVLVDRAAVSYREVAEHPLVGLGPGSSLQHWIETSLGANAPAARFRTLVPDLTTLIALAVAGVGLAVVPRRSVAPESAVEVCELTDSWARRAHLLCWGARERGEPEIRTALADHLRAAARRGTEGGSSIVDGHQS